MERFGWRFQVRDKVIQTENDYKKEVFNGDIGTIEKIDPVEQELSIRFDDRLVTYDYGELDEVSLAYAVTIHKSQGSEFPAVVIPVAMQHYMLLQRNLIYTGITRAKRLLVVVGQKKALGLAVRNDQSRKTVLRSPEQSERLRPVVPLMFWTSMHIEPYGAGTATITVRKDRRSSRQGPHRRQQSSPAGDFVLHRG